MVDYIFLLITNSKLLYFLYIAKSNCKTSFVSPFHKKKKSTWILLFFDWEANNFWKVLVTIWFEFQCHIYGHITKIGPYESRFISSYRFVCSPTASQTRFGWTSRPLHQPWLNKDVTGSKRSPSHFFYKIKKGVIIQTSEKWIFVLENSQLHYKVTKLFWK